MALVLCASCSRHVRVSSTSCPFCGDAIEGTLAVDGSRTRLSRAAMVFGAVAISVGAAACSKETIAQPYGAPPNPHPPEDAGAAVVSLYGAPPEVPTTPPTAIAAPYGAPPDLPRPTIDAGASKDASAPKKK